MERRQAPATEDTSETRRHDMQITTFTDTIWDDRVLPSPSPTETPTYMVPSSAAASSHSGQTSPLGTGMDPYGDGTYDLSTTTSTSSSLADSCSSAAVYDAEETEQDAHGTDWDQSSDQGSVAPKLEPVEDELFLDDLNAAPLTPNEATNSSEKQKRPRGRPRKHPVIPVTTGAKVAKGRSKTGCITCRKRKKKCDETKPRCMNCEKNAVVCEGYHEKQIWKSGKERAEEERMRRESVPSVALQPIFHAVETAEDKIFWRHYVNRLSNVLTVEGDRGNAFKDILLHLANQHEGLMHSILAVSSTHLDLDTDEGSKVLQLNPTTTRESLQERSQHHQREAFNRLYQDCSMGFDTDDPEHQTDLAARYGQILCQLLQTLVEGNADGEHRAHLNVYLGLIHASPPQNEAFHAFITEFFQYHIFTNDLLWHPDGASPRLVLANPLETGMNVYPQRLLGVGDGLFRYMAEINTIRNSVRQNLAAGIDPAVNYNDLYEAARIDTDLRNWSPTWPQGDNRAQVASLYRMVLWVYLHRTIYPFVLGQARRPSGTSPVQPPIINGVMATAPEQHQPPIQRRQSSAGIMPTNPIASPSLSSSSNGPPTRSSSMHEQDTRRPPSPPPSRRPSQDSQRLIIMVTESLDKLDRFAADDSVQTLLLIPCLILGTSCVDAAQHERIRAAVRNVRGYTGLRTCDRVLELLEKIWTLMERQHWAAVWDWQGTAQRMGLDFLCT